MIKASDLRMTMNGSRILDNLSFELEEGGMYGIIGPNGAGKSTLLAILSGVVPYDSGIVSLRGKTVGTYGRKELARWLAVLQQEGLPSTSFTVREIVAMGRFPYQNWLGHEARDAEALIDQVLAAHHLEGLASRRLSELSGGERQRVALAKVMVQEPELIMLDEPTTYLDIGYQVQLLDTVREWQRSLGKTVIAVLHDLNLAAQYCDRLLVLKDGAIASIGTPAEVLTEATILDVYGTEPVVLPHPESGVPQVLLRPQGNAAKL
jgi:iron complex transport system ATP-binding protein